MQHNAEERRQHPRYKLENSVSISSNGIFQINDLSQNGFCFKCPPFTAVPNLWKTDILTPLQQLKDYPAKRVWVTITNNGTHDFLPMVVGAKFGRLTKEQNDILSQLIGAISQSDSLGQ